MDIWGISWRWKLDKLKGNARNKNKNKNPMILEIKKSLQWDNQQTWVPQGRHIKWKDKSIQITQTEIKNLNNKKSGWNGGTDHQGNNIKWSNSVTGVLKDKVGKTEELLEKIRAKNFPKLTKDSKP